MEFDQDSMNEMSPTERFCRYFEIAKQVYCQNNDRKKVTQKAMVEWYNRKYKATLTEASLSKYLRGKNEVPIEVYVNIKELAGIEEMWLGACATREEYELSLNVKESLEFIKDEVESICRSDDLQNVCGDSMRIILKKFVEYCEYASINDYNMSLKKLKELQNVIYNTENNIAEKKYDFMYRRGQMKKSYSVRVSLQREHLTGKDLNMINTFDVILNKFHQMILEMSKCVCMQKKIKKTSFCDIPKLEEKKIGVAMAELEKKSNLR